MTTSWHVLLALAGLLAALQQVRAAEHRDEGVHGVHGVPGLSPPLCERPDCTCTEDPVVPGRGVRVSCDFGQPSSTGGSTAQLVSLNGSSLPARLQHLSVAGGGQVEVRLLQTAFSHLQLLERVSFSRLRRLLIRHHAFANASHDTGLLLEIEDCDAVVLESDAFLAVRAPLTALVARTGHVVLQGSALSWLRALSLVDIARLELHEHAFALRELRDVHERGSPLATVLLQNVVLAEVPRHAFPAPLADILIVGSEIRAIRRDAFSALQIRSVRLLDTSVHRLDGQAFSPRTLIMSLELRGARLHQVSSGAVSSAVNNLTISYSKLYEVLGGAFNLTVAAVSLRHSMLERVRSRGFALNKWTSMELHNNTFAWLEPFAFQAPFHPAPGVDAYRFRFTGNVIGNAMQRAFGFAPSPGDAERDEDSDDDGELLPPFMPAEVRDNLFERACHCQMHQVLEDLVTVPEPWGQGETHGLGDLLFNTSACQVDKRQAGCFGLSEGFLAMSNYTVEVCGSGVPLPCDDDDLNDVAGGAAGVGVDGGSLDDQNQLGPAFEHGDTTLTFEAGLQSEKKVLAAIFVFVVASLAMVLAVSGAAWLVRRGGGGRCSYTALCSRLRSLGATLTSDSSAGGLVSASSARSISRLSVHEYERQHATGTGVTGSTGVTTLTLHADDEDDDDWVACEDKATQTLPEELTQELLQTLREKLDDPDNYSEARDMIEHLYDLIKVEESCNSNHRSLSSLRLDELDADLDAEQEALDRLDEDAAGENLYDVIQPRRPVPRPRGPLARGPGPARGRGLQANRCATSVGTRAPSPDKLAGRRLVNQGQGQTQDQGQGHLCHEPRPAANMLRSIGQSLASLHSVAGLPGLGPPHAGLHGPNVRNRPALLCDYAEPTDAKVHVYCELPCSGPGPGPGPSPGSGPSPAEPPTAPCSPVVCRMANRPLPSKPANR